MQHIQRLHNFERSQIAMAYHKRLLSESVNTAVRTLNELPVACV